MEQWHPVTEPPPKRGRYLVWATDIWDTPPSVEFAYWHDEFWEDEESVRPIYNRPLYWMPLPAGPTEEMT